MNRYCVFLILGLLVALGGCTHLGQIRTDYAAVKLAPADDTNEILLRHCSPRKQGAFTERALKNAIEDYGTHLIGYVEYSDQGWEFHSGKQRRTLLDRLNADLVDKANSGTMFVNIVFVHGWHHNAEDGDCNVNEFRAMVHRVTQDINDAARRARVGFSYRINGIYVGWRSESVTAPLLRQASIVARRNSAEHIAKGAVRELFADLRALQFREQIRSETPRDRVRTIVVGHSFGVLIAYHSLSQALVNDAGPENGDHTAGRLRPMRLDAGCAAAVARLHGIDQSCVRGFALRGSARCGNSSNSALSGAAENDRGDSG